MQVSENGLLLGVRQDEIFIAATALLAAIVLGVIYARSVWSVDDLDYERVSEAKNHDD